MQLNAADKTLHKQQMTSRVIIHPCSDGSHFRDQHPLTLAGSTPEVNVHRWIGGIGDVGAKKRPGRRAGNGRAYGSAPGAGCSFRRAQHFRSRVLVRSRTRLKRGAIGVFGCLPGLPRLAEVGPLGEKAGASAAAIGTTGTVRAVELGVADSLIGEFRELAQRFEQVRDLRRAGRVGRPAEYQQQPRPIGLASLRGMPNRPCLS